MPLILFTTIMTMKNNLRNWHNRKCKYFSSKNVQELKDLEEMEDKEDNMSIEELEDSDLREKLALIDQLAIENKKDKDSGIDDLDDELEDDYDDCRFSGIFGSVKVSSTVLWKIMRNLS